MNLDDVRSVGAKTAGTGLVRLGRGHGKADAKADAKVHGFMRVLAAAADHPVKAGAKGAAKAQHDRDLTQEPEVTSDAEIEDGKEATPLHAMEAHPAVAAVAAEAAPLISALSRAGQGAPLPVEARKPELQRAANETEAAPVPPSMVTELPATMPAPRAERPRQVHDTSTQPQAAPGLKTAEASTAPETPTQSPDRIISRVERVQVEASPAEAAPANDAWTVAAPMPVPMAQQTAAPSPARQISEALAPAAVQLPMDGGEAVKSLRIELKPENLGTVEVTLKRRGNQLRLDIATSTPEAQRLIAHDHETLRRALEATGLTLPDGALVITLRQTPETPSQPSFHGGASFTAHNGGSDEAQARGQGAAARGDASAQEGPHEAVGALDDAGDDRRSGVYL